MEGQLWSLLYGFMLPLGKLRGKKRGQTFSDACVALVMLWAVLHDRPVVWACRLENWLGQCPWLTLPSQPTMSRRSRAVGVWLLLAQLFDLLNSLTPSDIFKHIDARPLAVGGASKDRDARRGYGAGQKIKGYKLHEIRSSSGHIEAWAISSMADREPTVAPKLIAQVSGGGYLTGDNGYDANALYEISGQQSLQLVAPPRPSAKGLGHRKHSVFRLRGLAMLENPQWVCGQPASFGQQLLGQRNAIERNFAHEVSFGCGFKSPPAWVRTPRRIGIWVQCKLIICLAWDAKRKMKIKDLHPG